MSRNIIIIYEATSTLQKTDTKSSLVRDNLAWPKETCMETVRVKYEVEADLTMMLRECRHYPYRTLYISCWLITAIQKKNYLREMDRNNWQRHPRYIFFHQLKSSGNFSCRLKQCYLYESTINKSAINIIIIS